MRPQRQRAQTRYLPQQRANVGGVGAAFLDGSQFAFGERGPEPHRGITVHPFSVAAVQCALPNFDPRVE